MNILYAVIDDLYSYTIGTLVRFFTRNEAFHTALLLESPKEEIEIGVKAESTKNEEKDSLLSFRGMDELLIGRRQVHTDNIAHSVMYVGSARAPLFMNPTVEFDGVVNELVYGSMAMVLEEKGRFARVSIEGKEGWILRDDLVDRAAYVYPEFSVGEENNGEDPTTLRVRAVIDDIFHGGESEFSLQAGEYVYYKLVRKGLAIHWPDIHPRTPGIWHSILKGTQGITIGVIPKVGSMIEYTHVDEIGHLAYVEAVFPDETIVLSEANYPDRGIYNERTLTKEEWTALNPVFIRVA